MQRYTVKQVVKLEKRAEFLDDLARQRLDDEFFFPLMLMVGMGIGITACSFNSDSQSLAPLILGASTQLVGGGKLLHSMTASTRCSKLKAKISNIYNTMGEEFKQDVMNELYEHKHGNNIRKGR